MKFYTRNDRDNQARVGFIAQDLQAACTGNYAHIVGSRWDPDQDMLMAKMTSDTENNESAEAAHEVVIISRYSCGALGALAVGLAGALGSQGGGGSLLAPQRVHCNKELVALCIEATSPSNTFDRRRRSADAPAIEESSNEEMLEFSDHMEWLNQMDRSEDTGVIEAERRTKQSRGERRMETMERPADSTEAGGAKTY